MEMSAGSRKGSLRGGLGALAEPRGNLGRNLGEVSKVLRLRRALVICCRRGNRSPSVYRFRAAGRESPPLPPGGHAGLAWTWSTLVLAGLEGWAGGGRVKHATTWRMSTISSSSMPNADVGHLRHQPPGQAQNRMCRGRRGILLSALVAESTRGWRPCGKNGVEKRDQTGKGPT
jgi:hypothetical protein